MTESTATIPNAGPDAAAVERLVDQHLEAYSEPRPQRRLTILRAIWATDGELVDPPFAATGHDEISTTIGAVHEHYPAHSFRRASAVEAHHDAARYIWEMVAPNGMVAITGVDVVQIVDGRLRRVTGFFGELPPARDD